MKPEGCQNNVHADRPPAGRPDPASATGALSADGTAFSFCRRGHIFRGECLYCDCSGEEIMRRSVLRMDRERVGRARSRIHMELITAKKGTSRLVENGSLTFAGRKRSWRWAPRLVLMALVAGAAVDQLGGASLLLVPLSAIGLGAAWEAWDRARDARERSLPAARLR